MGYKARNLLYRRGRLPGEGIVLQQMFFMSMQDKASSSVSNGRWESPLVASAEAKPSEKQKKQGRLFFPCHPQEMHHLWKVPFTSRGGPPKGSRGRAESPMVASAEAKPSEKQEKQGRLFFPCYPQEMHHLWKVPFASRGGPPKGSRGRAESPLVASAEAKPSAKQKKQDRLFPLPSTRNLFLVGGFVRLRADEVLSHTGKYPKGAGGGQRVHVSWPPPDPPLLRNSAPLASQGRAQLGSRPSLGGPLSPSRLAFTS